MTGVALLWYMIDCKQCYGSQKIQLQGIWHLILIILEGGGCIDLPFAIESFC